MICRENRLLVSLRLVRQSSPWGGKAGTGRKQKGLNLGWGFSEHIGVAHVHFAVDGGVADKGHVHQPPNPRRCTRSPYSA